MEIFELEEDIKVYCTTAKSFPDGIQEAFITLDKMLSREGRTFYGISYFDVAGKIVYKAAVSENFEGEADQYGFESSVITKGKYLTERIIDWRTHIVSIGQTFQTLLEQQDVDKTSPCVEWYKTDKEMLCMIKIGAGR